MEDTPTIENLVEKIKARGGAFIYGDSYTGKTTLAKRIIEALADDYIDANKRRSVHEVEGTDGKQLAMLARIKFIDNFDGGGVADVPEWVRMFNNVRDRKGCIIICSLKPPTTIRHAQIKNRVMELLAIKLTRVHKPETEVIEL